MSNEDQWRDRGQWNYSDLDWGIQTKHLGALPTFETRNSDAWTIFVRAGVVTESVWSKEWDERRQVLVEHTKDMVHLILGLGVD